MKGSFRKLFFIFSLLICTPLFAQQYGLDALGLAKLRADIIVQEADSDYAIGVLHGTFGNEYPKLKIVLDSPKFTTVRMHLGDGTVSNHTCSSNEKNLRLLRKWAAEAYSFSTQYPDKKWYVSPWLEHGCTDKALVSNWFKIIIEEFPSATPICSAFRGYCPPGILREVHGNSGKGDIRSNDGSTIFDSNSAQYRLSGSILTLGWSNCMNGRVTGEHQAPPPPQERINWCTRAEIKQVVRLLRSPESKPTLLACDPIKSPNLLKTNAEYYGKGIDDGRGNKPLLIMSAKLSKIRILSLEDKLIGSLGYYGTYQGGGFRYYMGGGYGSGQNPVDLMDQLGGEWGIAKAGGKCWLYNAIRRQGSYR